MRLVDLEPRWIHPNVFIFRCPCCVGTDRALWLSCRRNAPMPHEEQDDLFRANSPGKGEIVVGTDPTCVWTVSSDSFETMTVSPSLDYSKARHWHGNISSGGIK